MAIAERAAVLDLWLDLVPPTRLLACCWTPDDLATAAERNVTPIVVMRDLHDGDAADRFLRDLPPGSYVYSHPAHSSVLTLCARAQESDTLPAGGKLAKVSPDDIRAVRAETGPYFELWDASSRDIAGSVAAGASGVVATPLSPFAEPLPPRELAVVQVVLDQQQRQLDDLGSRDARSTRRHRLLPRAEWGCGGPILKSMHRMSSRHRDSSPDGASGTRLPALAPRAAAFPYGFLNWDVLGGLRNAAAVGLAAGGANGGQPPSAASMYS